MKMIIEPNNRKREEKKGYQKKVGYWAQKSHMCSCTASAIKFQASLYLQFGPEPKKRGGGPKEGYI